MLNINWIIFILTGFFFSDSNFSSNSWAASVTVILGWISKSLITVGISSLWNYIKKKITVLYYYTGKIVLLHLVLIEMYQKCNLTQVL